MPTIIRGDVADEADRTPMPTAPDVAAYFVAMAEGDGEENDITCPKVQKLCAYAQAFSLAALGRPMFDEDLHAWPHGPAIPSVYEHFSQHDGNVIPPQGVSVAQARKKFDDQQKFILELVHGKFAGFSAWGLGRLSHEDFPGPFTQEGRVIPKDAVRDAFMSHPTIVAMRALEKELEEDDGAAEDDLQARR